MRIRLLSEKIRGQCDDVPDISAVMYLSVIGPQLIVKDTSTCVRQEIRPCLTRINYVATT